MRASWRDLEPEVSLRFDEMDRGYGFCSVCGEASEHYSQTDDAITPLAEWIARHCMSCLPCLPDAPQEN